MYISRCTDISFLGLLLCFYRCERGSRHAGCRAGVQPEGKLACMFVLDRSLVGRFPGCPRPAFPHLVQVCLVPPIASCLPPVPVAIQKRSLFAFVIITNRISLSVCLSACLALPPPMCISFCACSCPILCVCRVCLWISRVAKFAHPLGKYLL